MGAHELYAASSLLHSRESLMLLGWWHGGQDGLESISYVWDVDQTAGTLLTGSAAAAAISRARRFSS